MQLPATASPSPLSAFDFVGADSPAGLNAGRPSIDHARSDTALDSFDDLLNNELAGAEALALLGLSTPPAPAPVVPPADRDPLSALDTGSSDSSPSFAGANDAATNRRQLVLGGLRPQATGAAVAATVPALDSMSGSTDPTAPPAIPAAIEAAKAGELTVPEARSSATSDPAGDVAADSAVSGDLGEPVILSLDEHRAKTATSVADDSSPTQHGSNLRDESARPQLLPFAPHVRQPESTAANRVIGVEATSGGSQPPGTRITAVNEQPPRSAIDSPALATPENQRPDETAEPLETAATDAISPSDQNVDSTSPAGDVSPLPLKAAIVTGTAVTSGTQPMDRTNSEPPRIGGSAGEIGRRTSEERGLRAPSADPSSVDGATPVADEPALAAVHARRPQSGVFTAQQQFDDAEHGDELSSPVQLSSTSDSGDATPLSEPSTSEPSVVQQVSQAVETWRDALQEQGTARFAAWLSPPDLGHVWVELTRSGEGITARLKASDADVQSLLETQEPELRQALNDSGVSVAELDLSGRAAGGFSSDHRQQHPERNNDVETAAVQPASAARRGAPLHRMSAIDVKA